MSFAKFEHSYCTGLVFLKILSVQQLNFTYLKMFIMFFF